jgi:hypothetical protein
VEAYKGKDLEEWKGPYPVFKISEDFRADEAVSAPDVHRYKGKHYLFVAFTSKEKLDPAPGRPPQVKRGTQVLVASSPLAPFKPLACEAPFILFRGQRVHPNSIFCEGLGARCMQMDVWSRLTVDQ